MDSYLVRRDARRLVSEYSEKFWSVVLSEFGTDDPGQQRALAEAIGRFRQAQHELSRALKRGAP